MATSMPFVQRRGDALFLRMAISVDLRSMFGRREITRTLRTHDRRSAEPLALQYAAALKRLFSALRGANGGRH